MTVLEYERKFHEPSKFDPSLIDTPFKKIKKFIEGMHQDFQESLLGHIHGTFTALMDMAIRYEKSDFKKSAK